MLKTTLVATCLLAVCAAVSMAIAATPPPLLNYQGVLRDPNGVPITGTREMTFRFFTDPNAGSEILIDAHTGGAAVMIDGGLFNVTLGGGAVSDGSGLGTYLDLAAVFADHAQVWLEITVAGETLTPRVQVLSAAYSLNASNLGGKPAGSFLDTSATTQTKSGDIIVDDLGVGDAITFLGPGPGRIFSSGVSLQLSPGNGIVSIENAGVEKARLDGGGNLQVDGNVQIGWDPNQGGAAALSFSNGGHVAIAPGSTWIRGSDTYDGILGLHAGSGSSSLISVAGNPTGLASGIEMQSADGYFNFSGSVSPFGSVKLTNRTSSSMIQMQPGGMTLIAGFDDTYDMVLIAGNDPTDGGISILGDSDVTLTSGNGLFNFVAGPTGTNIAHLASNGDLLIEGALTASGLGVGDAVVASGDRGILARGTYGTSDTGEAGKFCDTSYSGEAELGDGNTGVVGYGSFAGGLFRHRTSQAGNCSLATYTNEVRLATSTAAIESAAPKNFVQNHPYDPTKLVVYTSLEGDEVGTYTRGVGRLQKGVARVPLGETFAWVTNPGLGLTAHVTPRGLWNDLYVESVTTSELVVRSRDGGAHGAFDYIVHGLRVGFEEASVVRERDVDAYIPSMAPHEELYAREPPLRSLSAGERFKTMHEAAGERIDRDGGRALAAAIGVDDPGPHGAPRNQLLGGPIASAPVAPPEPATGVAIAAQPPAGAEETASSPAVATAAVPDLAATRSGATDLCHGVAGCALFPVDERIEAGEILALDPLGAVELTLATTAADRGVVGIALGGAADIDGRRLVAVISLGFAEIKADAVYGSIRPGDLLTASPTPGHAMRSDGGEPGTIVGKALEPLEAGTGTIRVLVMMR